MGMILNILYQSDDNYAPYMGVSICSLFENNKNIEFLKVFIIDDNISRANKNKLDSMAHYYGREIEFLNVKKILDDSQTKEIFAYVGFRRNKHSFLKLYIDSLLPDLHGKLIYIDCDTVIQEPLDLLMQFDMGDKIIGMVQDQLVGNSKTSVGLNDNDKYYNSGVILFDIDKWRSGNCFYRVVNHINNIRTYGTVDQDLLNVEFKNEICTLPLKYNVQPIYMVASHQQVAEIFKHKEDFYNSEEIQMALHKPAIIHFLRFIGEHPWNKDAVHPCLDYYNKYALISPWKDEERTEADLKLVFRIERFMYKKVNRGFFLRIFYFMHERLLIKSNRLK